MNPTYRRACPIPLVTALGVLAILTWLVPVPTQAREFGPMGAALTPAEEGLAGLASDGVPVLEQPADMTVMTGETADQALSASDPSGAPLAFSLVSGPSFAEVTTTGATTGNVHVAPAVGEQGAYDVTVQVTDGVLTDSKTFPVYALACLCPPVADAGDPHYTFVNVPTLFHGTRSYDPNNLPLTYAWDFGDGGTGSGPTPTHTFTSPGGYVVRLTVTNPIGLSNSAWTTITVVWPLYRAKVFTYGGDQMFRLSRGKSTVCVGLEPVANSFRFSDLDLGSFVMAYGSSQISAIPGKSVLVGDRDRDGVEDIPICFAMDDVRRLFDWLPPGGHAMVELELHGTHITFPVGIVTGALYVEVIQAGGLAASVSPNPLRPTGTLTVTTQLPGTVIAHLYDVSGRLVRKLANGFAPPGVHSIEIDGHDAAGKRLPSGVYFYRIQAAEGIMEGKVVVAR